MQRILLLTLCTVLAGCRPSPKKASGNLDLSQRIAPVPRTAVFGDPDWYTWCGTLEKGDDGKYHLYYSRWKRELGHNAWVTHSEVAHAVGNTPFGPFTFHDIALPARSASFWDGLCTHNPTIHRYAGKYYLYYMGNTGDGKATSDLNMVHRNNQRIGVAVADDPNGPWKRSDTPLIDVGSDSGAPDALMTSNPSVTQRPDGSYLMVYKAVGRKTPGTFGGPVVHLTAVADHPSGPFRKQPGTVFDATGTDFPAEDPYIWYQDGRYWAIVKDMHGAFTNAGQSLVLFESKTGFDWKLAQHPLVSRLEIRWADGQVQRVEHLERPQLYFESGRPIVLLVAADTTRDHSFNVQIPLR